MPDNKKGDHHMLRNQRASLFPATQSVEILAPTLLEYWAIRSILPHARVSWAGVRLARWKLQYPHSASKKEECSTVSPPASQQSIIYQENLERSIDIVSGSIVVVCGLAGALVHGLLPGSILIPERVGLADGRIMHCDPILVQMLVSAAHTLHFRSDSRPLLTAQTMIVGSDRHTWSGRGFVAADMETGLLAGRGLRVATIRVVLDYPEQNISPDWLQPTKAFLQPSRWRELFWLSRVAPQYVLRAAHVLKVGLGIGPEQAC